MRHQVFLRKQKAAVSPLYRLSASRRSSGLRQALTQLITDGQNLTQHESFSAIEFDLRADPLGRLNFTFLTRAKIKFRM